MHPSTTAGPSSSESRILILTSFGHTLCHVSELAFIGLIPAVVAEFQISVDKATLLPLPGFIMYGVGALPTGLWTDRRGSRKAMTVYFFAVMMASLAVYLAPGLLGICMGLTFLGAAISIYHPASLAMLSLGCPNRGRAMGINGVAGNLGVASGPALGLLVLLWFSWRTTYLFIAVAALIGLIGSVALRIELPAIESGSKKTPTSRGGSGKALVILFLAMLTGGFNYRCLTTVLPSYLTGNAEVAQRGASAGKPPTPARQAGTATSSPSSEGAQGRGPAAEVSEPSMFIKSGGTVFLVFAIGGIGQLIGGYLADRFSPTLLYAATITTTIPLALAVPRLPLPGAAWVVGVMAIFVFAQQPFENSIVAEATPTKYRSTMYGLKFVLAFGLASLGAYVAGLTWRFYGLPRVFDIYAAGAVLMATLGVSYAIVSRRNATKVHA